jgi:hypothetical protein
MSIHDPRIEVTCDGEGCRESIEVIPDYKYRSMASSSGFYDCSDSAIEDKLTDEGWLVENGKYFCGENCKPKEDEEASA